ncbi:MAG: NAD-binding protein [Planctomycetes bacterium]|nr:NAD-binding protein [Planctomycetota bacterium]
MALNLVAAGCPLVVHNRSRAAVDELVAAGARAAACPREVAAAAGVVITMLPDGPDVEAVLRGPDGVFAGARPGTLVVDMSTISPVTARQLAGEARERGLEMLDAPVSGGTAGARDGTLSIMVGGSEAALARARPVLEILGKTITHLGGPGAGQVGKACNQVVVALAIEAVGEALVLAEKAGVDPAKVREALLGGFARSRILDVHGLRALERNFTPGFKAHMQLKDLAIALAAGREYGAVLPAAGVVAELYKSVCAAGDGGADHSVLMAHVARLAGLDWKP